MKIMKNTGRLFLLISIITTNFCYSQYSVNKDSKVKVSNAYPVFDGAKYYYSYDGDIHTLKFHAKNGNIHQVFNGEDLRLKSSEDLSKREALNGILGSVETKSGDYIFSYSRQGKKEMVSTYVSQVNFDNSNPIDNGTKLENITCGEDVFNGNAPLVSDDKSKVLFNYTISPENYKEVEQVGLMVFNDEFESIWSAQFPFPYTRFNSDILDYFIDNNGNVYILMKYFYAEDEKEYNRKYVIQLMRIDGESYSIETIQPEDGGTKYSVSFGYADKNNGTMDAIIFYANSGKGEEVENEIGLMLMSMNDEGEFDEEKIIEIPDEFIRLDITEKKEKSVRYRVEYKSSQTDKEGNLTIVGKVITSARNSGVSVNALRNSFLVLQVDKNGDINWIKKMDMTDIPYKIEDNKCFYSKNALQIVCGSKTNDESSKDNSTYISVYTIDLSSGDVVKDKFFNYEKVNDLRIYQFSFNRIQKVDEGVFVMESYKKKKEDVMIKFKTGQ